MQNFFSGAKTCLLFLINPGLNSECAQRKYQSIFLEAGAVMFVVKKNKCDFIIKHSIKHILEVVSEYKNGMKLAKKLQIKQYLSFLWKNNSVSLVDFLGKMVDKLE